MTEHHSSEEKLFEDDSQIAGREDKPSHSRRISLGPRLPVRMSDNSGSSSNEGSPKERKVQRPAGTVLGGGNMNGIMLTIPQKDGTSKDVNVWTDVINGAEAKHVHKFLTAVSRTKAFDSVEFIEGISYQGFSREAYIKAALKTLNLSVFIRFAILGAVRGSNFPKIKDTCEGMPDDLIAIYDSGRIVKKAKKRTDLTILRFTASVPEWCAYWMHGAGTEKKIQTENCPAYLQFPSAASIPMSVDLRRQHIKFSIAFSRLLPGGKFNANIYLTAYNNMIPISQVPQSLLLQLGVQNQSDATTLSTEEIQTYINENSK